MFWELGTRVGGLEYLDFSVEQQVLRVRGGAVLEAVFWWFMKRGVMSRHRIREGIGFIYYVGEGSTVGSEGRANLVGTRCWYISFDSTFGRQGVGWDACFYLTCLVGSSLGEGQYRGLLGLGRGLVVFRILMYCQPVIEFFVFFCFPVYSIGGFLRELSYFCRICYRAFLFGNGRVVG